MDEADDGELEALRSRAYGPGADIHLDAEALGRLKELEERRRPQRPPAAEVQPEPVAAPLMPMQPVEAEEPEVEHPLLPLVRRLGHRLARVRRSTVLIVLGVVAFAVAVTTTLVVVDRVQNDPLQTGAVQIARLSVDSDYEVPGFLRSGPGETPTLGFEEFHGLRAVVGPSGPYTTASDDVCLFLYSVVSAESAGPNSF